jgi:hypothetical protein
MGSPLVFGNKTKQGYIPNIWQAYVEIFVIVWMKTDVSC